MTGDERVKAAAEQARRRQLFRNFLGRVQAGDPAVGQQLREEWRPLVERDKNGCSET